jgi:hypothetical protein
VPTLTYGYGGRPNYTYQRKPWDTRPEPGKKAGWWDDVPVEDEERFAQENKYVVVYLDEKADAHVEAEKARYAEFDKRRTVISRVRWEAMKSIEEAWVKRAEAEAYEKFIADFVDPELWEGHRKQLRINYPHDHHRRYVDDPLDLLVTWMVEEGIEFNGLTVWEAATAHFPGVEWIKRVLKDEHFGAPKVLPEAVDIPEDLRDLKFSAPEVEEDDEDDEELIDEGVLEVEE